MDMAGNTMAAAHQYAGVVTGRQQVAVRRVMNTPDGAGMANELCHSMQALQCPHLPPNTVTKACTCTAQQREHDAP